MKEKEVYDYLENQELNKGFFLQQQNQTIPISIICWIQWGITGKA